MSSSTSKLPVRARQQRTALLAVLSMLMLSASSTAFANKTSAVLAVGATVVDSCQVASTPVLLNNGGIAQDDSSSQSAFGLQCRQVQTPFTQVGNRAPQFGVVGAQELAALAELAGAEGKPVVVTLYF